VADEIEIELIVKQVKKQRMAVGGRARHCLGGDLPLGARPVFDDEWLAETLREPLTDQSRKNVGWAAGRKADHDADRSRRIDLRPREARHGRQRDCTRGQMQKFPAGKFHFEPPYRSNHSITSSTRASSVSGTVRPIAFAVLRLITSSYFVGACTERSAGFSPLRMRST